MSAPASGGRVLVVDDEEGLRMTVAANLELEGFEVVEAGSGSEALALLDESFDVVVSDICMPDMNGIEMHSDIRARFEQLPVVLMTAYTTEDAMQDAFGAGVFTVMPKPFDIERLVRVLRNAIRRPAVLVVDDDAKHAASLVEVLRAANLHAEAVTDGERALAVLADASFDICVTDLCMPQMDGAELTVQIGEAAKQVTVIVVTGYDAHELMRRAADAGAVAVMRKPVDVVNLLRTIANARGPGA